MTPTTHIHHSHATLATRPTCAGIDGRHQPESPADIGGIRNLVLAESLQALAGGDVISQDQHIRLRGLAAGLRQLNLAPDMKALEALARLAIKAQLKREKSDRNLLRSNSTKEQVLAAIRSTRTLKEAAEELGESERTIRNKTTRHERKVAMKERGHHASEYQRMAKQQNRTQRKAASDRVPTRARPQR